jgi:hypothetical protein
MMFSALVAQLGGYKHCGGRRRRRAQTGALFRAPPSSFDGAEEETLLKISMDNWVRVQLIERQKSSCVRDPIDADGFRKPVQYPQPRTVSAKHWSSALPAAKNASSISQDCCDSTQNNRGLLALPPWSSGLELHQAWGFQLIYHHPQDQASPALWARKRPCQDDPASLQAGPGRAYSRITDYHEGTEPLLTAFWPPAGFSSAPLLALGLAHVRTKLLP